MEDGWLIGVCGLVVAGVYFDTESFDNTGWQCAPHTQLLFCSKIGWHSSKEVCERVYV